jgi:hypothetical protein
MDNLLRFCQECMKKLNYISTHKINYKYCKKCWNSHKKIYTVCSCGVGFLKPCIYNKLCNKLARKCYLCSDNWIYEYCDECR